MKTSMSIRVLLVAVVLTINSALFANDVGPILTDVQRLTFQTLSQRLEIAQLKAQAAQAEFDKAKAELLALVQASQVPGYDLDLSTLAYVKKAEPVPNKPAVLP